MANEKMPAFISYVVIVHAGSYNNFLKQLQEIKELNVKFVKRVAIHYYIVQIEDLGKTDKQKLYDLPIMAMREEFSSYIFFKQVRSYNNVLKIMCKAKENDKAAYDLLQNMLTPFEKYRLLNLEDAKELQITEFKEKDSYSTTYYGAGIETMAIGKLFNLDKVTVDKKEINFNDLVKDQKWFIGIKA
jgi:Trp operon repressor